MDFVNFLVIVGLIILFSKIQNRRKSARRGKEPEQQEQEERPRKVKKRIIIRRRVPAGERTEMPAEVQPAPRAQPVPNAEGGYDYEAFRRKLRKAWKMPEEGTASDGVYREETKQDDCAIQKEMKKEPARDIPKPERRAAPKPAVRPAPKEVPKAVFAPRAAAARTVTPEKSIWEKKPVAASRIPKAAAAGEEPQRVWTEEDVRRWMMYDAVFGEPRARRPWTPRRRA